MIAFAAISFGSVYAHGTVAVGRHIMQNDTTKKKTKKDTTRKKKDTTSVQPIKQKQ